MDKPRRARVLIAGAGALGSVFGALLCRAGHAVTLLGRDPHMEAIRRAGLHVSGIWGEHHADGLYATTRVEDTGDEFDAILVCVKSFDTEAITRGLEGRLQPQGVWLSLQNGLGNAEAIARAADSRRVLAARVIFGATVDTPGQVRVTVYAEPVLVGAPLAADNAGLIELAGDWAAAFAAAGIPAEPCADVGAALWGKALYNAALNPLGALLGVHYGALPEHPDTRALMDLVIDEAFAVAQAEAVNLPWASPAEYRSIFYDRLVPSTYDHRSSMLQDLERGRRTEIDAINGEIWRRGIRHGIVTPTNEALTRLVRARQGCSRQEVGE